MHVSRTRSTWNTVGFKTRNFLLVPNVCGTINQTFFLPRCTSGALLSLRKAIVRISSASERRGNNFSKALYLKNGFESFARKSLARFLTREKWDSGKMHANFPIVRMSLALKTFTMRPRTVKFIYFSVISWKFHTNPTRRTLLLWIFQFRIFDTINQTIHLRFT